MKLMPINIHSCLQITTLLQWQFLSQNQREIDIAELISASIEVIIACKRGFPNNTSWGFP